MNKFYRFIRNFGYPIIKVFWPTKFVNKERFYEMGGGIVICNHYTKVDAMVPSTDIFTDEFHALCKAEQFESSKIVSWFLYKVGAIPVKRGEADIDAVKAVLSVLKEDKKILIFPEGTRNREGTQEMREFKDGVARFAIKTQKPILPMIYYNSPKVFRQNYLYIGEPITLDKYYGVRGKAAQEAYAEATQYIYDQMVKTRQECNAYVDNLKKNKKKK